MRSRFLLLIAALGLIMTSCGYEEMNDHSALQSHCQVTAIIDDETISRSNAEDTGIFTWSTGDEIAVYTSGSKWAKGQLTGGEGSATATFSIAYGNGETAAYYAVYPYNTSHSVSGENLTINLPAVYDYSSEDTYTANTNAPMVATIENGATEFNFKHVGAVIRFNVANVPAGASQFVFTATDKRITGNFTIDQNGQINTEDANDDGTVTIKFKALETAAANMKFFIPVPVGTYNGMTIEVKDAEGKILGTSSTTAAATISRKKLMLGPTLTIATGSMENVTNVSSSEELADAIAKGGNITLTADITLSETLTISKDVVIDLNGSDLDASSNTSRPFNVQGGSLTINGGTSYIKVGKYGLVNIPDGSDATVVLNGGVYTGNTDNGAFIKPRGNGNIALTLNNVNYTDSSTNGWVINLANYDGTEIDIKIDGGVYSSAGGINIVDGEIKNATITATGTVWEYGPAIEVCGDEEGGGEVSIDKCIISSATYAITAGSSSVANVKDCTVTSSDKAYVVFPTGGTINVTGGSYTGDLYIYDLNQNATDSSIVINGNTEVRKTANN